MHDGGSPSDGYAVTETQIAICRITRLENIEAIRALKSEYTAACDRGYDPDNIAALFTEDGTWERPDLGVEHCGRNEIAAAMSANGRKYTWSIHMLSEPRISVELEHPDRALGKWPMLCLLGNSSRVGEIRYVAGTYENEFEMYRNKWLISRLTVHVTKIGMIKERNSI
jgi:hypothetical protein